MNYRQILEEAVKEKDSRDPAAHYQFTYKGIKLDPARIAEVYGINQRDGSGMLFTILKKCLRAGTAHKGLEQDLKDIIAAAERKLEMLGEDNGQS